MDIVYVGVSKVNRLNIRNAPSGDAYGIYLNTGDTFKADIKSNQWFHLIERNGYAVNREEWISEGRTPKLYLDYHTEQVVEPPVEPPVDPPPVDPPATEKKIVSVTLIPRYEDDSTGPPQEFVEKT